ncbi:dihydrofolate reductase [Pediococcus claussenii]|uniref:Dihydrofolate reductase n=1 Tax=Pediococcus claussenii (strain ATCC BAA-344 / DSM 14800 / JCM 18046 / KCTC 3811 / LMG 21948 / P06) TaxID=701521 RepID=G8PD50_PEDCP|nr:dihydrofolate reductase [Pediococcus claussenii]AEV95185.1 dihydrofolate reductase [Pediococcus claussenii ATCC BAA-344]ANZ70417.1 hypothetical protein AYR57_08845 [Pediococcus claussenii]ANZ72233.1 hypothetical protein AYR58_08845 [Pediococcus claussenii]KRN19632.1 dfrA protein [Pediococcus claussenii]
MIALIVAMDNKRGIGKNNTIPWHLPDDVKFFKDTTTGHSVIMGRKTFESIGKPLRNRQNIVITRAFEQYVDKENLQFVHSMDEVEEYIDTHAEQDFFVIGGSKVYQEFSNLADRIYLTQIKADFECDTFAPEFNLSEYKLIEQKEVDTPIAHEFQTWQRK